MSILIKGKKMPKCCVGCWAAEICRHYDRFSNYERPEYCPLVEVADIDTISVEEQRHDD